jgi:phosphomannomutase
LMCKSGQPLSALVGERMRLFPASGEINRRLATPAAVLQKVREIYADNALAIDVTDGLSMEFPEWRFNLRSSNTEPVVRLNVEARGDESLMRQKTEEILEKMARLDGVG